MINWHCSCRVSVRLVDFRSGPYFHVQAVWSTIELKTFSILVTTRRFRWLALTSAGYDLFAFDTISPSTLNICYSAPDINQAPNCNAIWWSFGRSSSNYTFFRIGGINNIWANVLARWSILLIILLARISTISFHHFPKSFLVNLKCHSLVAETHPSTSLTFELEERFYLFQNKRSIWMSDEDAVLQHLFHSIVF